MLEYVREARKEYDDEEKRLLWWYYEDLIVDERTHCFNCRCAEDAAKKELHETKSQIAKAQRLSRLVRMELNESSEIRILADSMGFCIYGTDSDNGGSQANLEQQTILVSGEDWQRFLRKGTAGDRDRDGDPQERCSD